MISIGFSAVNLKKHLEEYVFIIFKVMLNALAIPIIFNGNAIELNM